MKENCMVWLASYPRSGNTLLRTVLWQCFGLKSGSVYSGDLGGNEALESYVGHVEQGADGSIHFPVGNRNMPMVKTHGNPPDKSPAIYVVRDGRAACASLWSFYNDEVSLADMVEGRHRFGGWSNHLMAWEPWARPDTLLLRYEDLVADLPLVLQQISDFLARDILRDHIPERAEIAEVDGKWVKNSLEHESALQGEWLDRFNTLNRPMLERLGYPVHSNN